MKIQINKLGKIKNSEVDLTKNLILFTGYNNTGKTYLNYLLYGLYKLPYEKIEKYFYPLIKTNDLSDTSISIKTDLNYLFSEQINEIELIYSDLLKKYCTEIYADNNINPDIQIIFSKNTRKKLLEINKEEIIDEHFNINNKDVKIQNSTGIYKLSDGILTIDLPRITKKEQKNYNQIKAQIIDILKLNTYIYFEEKLKKIASFNHIQQRDYNRRVYFFPAERAALNQYAYDIIYSKAEKYEENENPYPYETLQNKNIPTPDYPLAINDYIKIVYNLRKKRNQKSDFEKIAVKFEKMLGGKVFVDQHGAIKFQMSNNQTIGIHLSSSTIKSLAGLVLYLKHIAEKNDVIFIDEPELNLHPKNQKIVARLLATLMNARIKLIISTHSDFITKELSNQVMLSKKIPEREELKKEFNFSENEFINKNNIKIYTFNNNGKITNINPNDYGVEIESFDNEIDKQSYMYDKIYYTTS